MARPRVSAICIFYNAERFLAEAIESVIAQSFDDFEFVLVDDGSSDRSSEIAKNYVRRYPERLRYVDFPGHANRGMSAARNLGIRHSTGQFIAFIDSDDRWRPDKLAEQVALIDSMPDAGVVCGTVNYWQSWSGGKDRLVTTGYRPDFLSQPPDTIFKQFPIGFGDAPCPSDVLLKRELVESVGGFEEQFLDRMQVYEDQAFFAKAYLVAPVFFSSAVWLDYRLHEDSCVAGVKREGLDTHLRIRFFDWLRSYVEGHAVPEKKRLLGAVEKCRRELRYLLLARMNRRARRCSEWLKWKLRP